VLETLTHESDCTVDAYQAVKSLEYYYPVQAEGCLMAHPLEHRAMPVQKHLEQALAEAESQETRYHIRSALQLLE
jgi:hypothetical protein